VRDTNLALKASAAETESTAGTIKDFGGPDVQPLTYVVIVTAISGTGTPTLTLKIQQGTDSTDTEGMKDALLFPVIAATGVYRLTAKLKNRYRRYSSTITGTNPSFTYSIYPELGGHYDQF
jgi:hypothetical protein